MSLKKEFRLAVSAGQTGIRINTDEIADALTVISGVCEKHGWELRIWDKTKGLQHPGAHAKQTPGTQLSTHQALAALQSFIDEAPMLDTDQPETFTPVVTVIKNFHLAVDKNREEISSAVQHLLNQKVNDLPVDAQKKLKTDGFKADDTEHTGKFLIVLMPAEVKLPPELDPLFHVINHELPDEEELTELMSNIAIAGQNEPTNDEQRRIIQSAMGLTRLQAEGTFAASAILHSRIDPDYVWREKADILNREGLIEIRQSGLKYANVGGLAGFKEFLKRLLASDELERVDPDAKAKGVMVVGPPGTGKSLMAEATGGELNWQAVATNPGNLMGGYIGDTERNTRRFFQILRRLAPVIVIMDETSKVMPSGKEHGEGSDVGRRLLGTFLTQMNDLREPVFWFFTENSIEGMHEAFLRAERVDAIVYVRKPDAQQRAEVWRIYLKKFFPRQVNERDDPRYVELEIDVCLEAYKKLKKVSPIDYGVKVAAALQATHGKEREHWLQKIKDTDENLHQAVRAHLVDDEDWTPAEIRSCCRLARRLREPLSQTAKRIQHVLKGERGGKLLRRLDRWAADTGALDADTGEIFIPPEERDSEDGAAPSTKKVRRRVRTLNDKKEDA